MLIKLSQATPSEIERAARIAAAHGFITQLPQGYETVLGEAGIGLSGGQKQRVSIARALAPHPKLVLADEPTAALDSHAGRDVVKILRNLAHTQNCAILIVTHDNRILDIADRRIHVEDGFLSCFES